MKKVISLMLALMLALSIGMICAAAEDSANVYVTITDKDGSLAVAASEVTVTDVDKDGALTITDALYCAHEAFYDGGAAAGYATRTTEYGLSLDKLWGTANGGSYGYYVNGASAWSLTDAVKEGDYLYAFTYTDLTAWSDKFSTFDKFMGGVDAAEGVELTLTYVAEYDEYYMPVFKPFEGAKIIVNGKDTDIVTDADGKAVVTFDQNGTAIITAKADSTTLTPPVFIANVTGAPEPTEEEATEIHEAEETTQPTEKATPDEANNSGKSNPNAIQTGTRNTVIYIALMFAALAVAVIVLKKKHEN